MLERLRKYHTERRARKKEDKRIRRNLFLTCAYRLDEDHLNTGWTNEEFNSFVNTTIPQLKDKPLSTILTNFVLWNFVNQEIMDVSQRKNFAPRFRLSAKGQEEIEPIIIESINALAKKD